jgi:hypothetical protein
MVSQHSATSVAQRRQRRVRTAAQRAGHTWLGHHIRLALVRACVNSHAINNQRIIGLDSDESSDDDFDNF